MDLAESGNQRENPFPRRMRKGQKEKKEDRDGTCARRITGDGQLLCAEKCGEESWHELPYFFRLNPIRGGGLDLVCCWFTSFGAALSISLGDF